MTSICSGGRKRPGSYGFRKGGSAGLGPANLGRVWRLLPITCLLLLGGAVVTRLLEIPFVFPDVAGKKILLLGLGGGSDVITAFALSGLFDPAGAATIVYGNTKTSDLSSVEPITQHVFRVSGPVFDPARKGPRGPIWIDRSVPRGPEGCPWIVLLKGEDDLVGELRSLSFDLLIGADTGGDSIARKGGRGHRVRDQRMLAVLRRVGPPVLH